MVLMAAGGGFPDGNVSHWWDQKHPSFPIQTPSENNIWETNAGHMVVAKEVIRKAIGRVNALLEYWGVLTPPDNMGTGSTLTGTASIICTQTWKSFQSVQFNSTPNEIQQLEPAGVPCLQSAYLRYTNHGTRKYSAL